MALGTLSTDLQASQGKYGKIGRARSEGFMPVVDKVTAWMREMAKLSIRTKPWKRWGMTRFGVRPSSSHQRRAAFQRRILLRTTCARITFKQSAVRQNEVEQIARRLPGGSWWPVQLHREITARHVHPTARCPKSPLHTRVPPPIA